MPFAEPEDPVPARVVTAPEVVVELLDVLLFLAQEIVDSTPYIYEQ